MTPTDRELEALRKIAEGAALSLKSAHKRYEANKPLYQEGFTPSWLTTAEVYYRVTRGNYERALAEVEAARGDMSK